MTRRRIMTGRRIGKVQVGAGLLLVCAVFLAAAKAQQRGEEQPEATKAPASRTVRGRLPAYFSAVVTPKQREEIYKIQADFDHRLETLRAQMEELIAERDQAVDGVLDQEQLASVNKKREEARKKRAERGGAGSPERPAESDATPPAP